MCCSKGGTCPSLLYGVIVLDSCVLGMALLLLILAGPVYQATETNPRDGQQMAWDGFSDMNINRDSQKSEIPKLVTLISAGFSALQILFLIILALGQHNRNSCLLVLYLLWCVVANVFVISVLIFGEIVINKLGKMAEQRRLSIEGETDSFSASIQQKTTVPLLKFFESSFDVVDWYLIILAVIKAFFGLICVIILSCSISRFCKESRGSAYGAVPA